MKTRTIHILLLAALCLMVACKQKEVFFTYSPSEPRAGQSIKFTNATSEGEKWEWSFGDGSSASSKNPSKIYKRSGTYTVTLKVDGKASLTHSETITVVDTIPTIDMVGDSVAYFNHPVTLKMSAYNPYSRDLTYEWHLGDCTVLVDPHDEDESQITVLFTRHDTTLSVGCHLTIGDDEYDGIGLFYVHDTLAPTLLMTTAEGQLLRQRAFELGDEEPVSATVPAGILDSICSMAVDGDHLYLFSALTTQAGAIHSFDLQDGTTERLIYNALDGAEQGFVNGMFADGMLFWTSPQSGIIYCSNTAARNRAFTAGTTSPLYWGDITRLGYGQTAGLPTTGLATYNALFFLGYGQGIYRFTAADRGQTTTPEAGAILTDRTLIRFAIDPMARKIYFVDPTGLYVCSLSGDQPRLISAAANGNGLCIDNYMNRVYWTETDGVFYMPLVQSANNAFLSMPVRFNHVHDILSITIDATPRKCSGKH